jgi:tetratricopeptide (TPR) repeat protein
MSKHGKSKSKKSVTSLKNIKSTKVPAWLTNSKLHKIIIFAICCLLYANTLKHDYALDDAIVIYDNEFTTQGFSGIGDLLKYDTFRGFFKVEGKEALVAGGRYRPLTPILFAVLYQFFGASPMAGHLLNVLLYALTCLLLYMVLLRLFSPDGKEEKAGVYAYFVSFIAAMIFAVHPIHTEVVANIKGADEVVTLLLSLVAVWYSLKAYFDKNKLANIWASIAFFMALMAKENAITFLAVVPFAYYFFTKAKGGEIFKQTLPFIIGAVLFIALRTYILGFITSEPSQELMNNPFLKLVDGRYIDFTFGEKMATIFFTLGKYLQLLFFPHPLTHDYYPRAVGIMTFGDWRVILSVLAYVAMGIYALIRLPKRDPISFGIIAYLATLSIASNIVIGVGTNMNERFTFMPSIGFALIVAVLGYRFTNRMTAAKKLKELNQLPLALGFFALIIFLFSVKTVTRNTAWKNNFTLFTTDVKTSTMSAKLRNSAGGVLIEEASKTNNETEKKRMLNEAVGHLQEAVKIHPGYKNAYLLMGNANNYLQNYDVAVQNYQQAMKLDPNYEEAQNNLGITYREAGKFYGEQKGDLQKAMTYLQKAYDIRPNEYETVRLLGVAYGFNRQNAQAIEMFKKATILEPKNADAWYNLGSAYYQAGDEANGQINIQKALQINPKIQEERAKRQ